jgi:FecR protein
MRRTLFFICSVVVLGCSTLLEASSARAETPLTRATIQTLIKTVKLMPQNARTRDAKMSDVMRPKDALSTGRSSRAHLKFNDGSLARVGELAQFRFLPNTREFSLNNGTVLLLIPPSQGTTYIRTPHGSAGIRGSALFVRHDAATGITIIGALTNNPKGPMEIQIQDVMPKVDLHAGELAFIKNGKIQVYKFDLKEFYETSDLVQGLDLTGEGVPNADPGIAKVQVETVEALSQQKDYPLTGNTIENPPEFALSQDSDKFARGFTDPYPLSTAQNPVDPFQTRSGLLVGNPTSGTPSIPTAVIPDPPDNRIIQDPRLGPAETLTPAGIQQPVSNPTLQPAPPPAPVVPPTTLPVTPTPVGSQVPGANPNLQPAPTPAPVVPPTTLPVTPTPVGSQAPAPTPTPQVPVVNPTPVVTTPVVSPTLTTPVVTPTVITPVVSPTLTTPVVTPTVTTPVVTPTLPTTSAPVGLQSPAATLTVTPPAVTAPVVTTPVVTPVVTTPAVSPTLTTPTASPTLTTPATSPTLTTPPVTTSGSSSTVTPTP